MNKERVVAFSDAIVAIIITILALDLPKPDSFTFEALLSNWSRYLVYIANFVIITGMWYQHHNLFEKITFISKRAFWANSLWLLLQSFIPFVSSWVYLYPYKIVPTLVFLFINMLWVISYRLTYMALSKDNNIKPYSVKYTLVYISVFIVIGASTLFNINVTRILLFISYSGIVYYSPCFDDRRMLNRNK